jgi:hypothetical protein
MAFLFPCLFILIAAWVLVQRAIRPTLVLNIRMSPDEANLTGRIVMPPRLHFSLSTLDREATPTQLFRSPLSVAPNSLSKLKAFRLAPLSASRSHLPPFPWARLKATIVRRNLLLLGRHHYQSVRHHFQSVRHHCQLVRLLHQSVLAPSLPTCHRIRQTLRHRQPRWTLLTLGYSLLRS